MHQHARLPPARMGVSAPRSMPQRVAGPLPRYRLGEPRRHLMGRRARRGGRHMRGFTVGVSLPRKHKWHALFPTGSFMNFAPRLPLPFQLTFAFADSPELEPLTPWERLGVSRSTFFAHRRLRRV